MKATNHKLRVNPVIRLLCYHCANCLGKEDPRVSKLINHSSSVSSSEKSHLSSARQFRNQRRKQNTRVSFEKGQESAHSNTVTISKQILEILNIKIGRAKAMLNMAHM